MGAGVVLGLLSEAAASVRVEGEEGDEAGPSFSAGGTTATYSATLVKTTSIEALRT